VSQGVGPEFKLQYHKKKKGWGLENFWGEDNDLDMFICLSKVLDFDLDMVTHM
jgi:hypothetical protein